MDFELLKQEAEKSCSALLANCVAAKRKLALIENHYADALSRRTRLEAQKIKLTSSADSSVGESVNSFEQFQTSLRKINSQIVALGEAALVLKDKVIPGEREKVSECAKKLQAAILEFWRPHQQTCEKQMRELLDEIIRLRDDFETAFIKSADDCGLQGGIFLGMHEIYGSILPKMRHPRFKDPITVVGKRFDVPATPQAEPQAPAEATGTPQIVQDGQTPVEPVPDTLPASSRTEVGDGQTPVEPAPDTPEAAPDTPDEQAEPVQDTVLEAILTPEPALARTVLG